MKTRAWWAGLTDEDFIPPVIVNEAMPAGELRIVPSAPPADWHAMNEVQRKEWLSKHSARIVNVAE